MNTENVMVSEVTSVLSYLLHFPIRLVCSVTFRLSTLTRALLVLGGRSVCVVVLSVVNVMTGGPVYKKKLKLY